MKKMTAVIVAPMIVLGIALCLLGQQALAESETKNTPEPRAAPTGQSQLAEDMIGTWVLVGTPDHVGEPQAAGGQLKFFTGRHWVVTQADPNTGVVIHHHGGTYTLNGDECIERTEYANPGTMYLIKHAATFKARIDGDVLTYVGIGNPWRQVWKRVK